MKSKLTKCKACGAEIAKTAKTCPQCGAKHKSGHPILAAILLLIAIGIFCGSMSHLGTTQNKVTLEKFNKVTTGMTYEQVIEIIGFEGELNSEVDFDIGEQYRTEIYTWINPNGSNMNATFQGGVLVTKAQAGLK